MKYIIDIPEEYYKTITDIPNRQCTIDMLIIKNGTPLEDIKEQYDKGYKDGVKETFIEELEKIKAEILNYIIKPNTDEEEAIMQIIDNKISELKGENNAE